MSDEQERRGDRQGRSASASRIEAALAKACAQDIRWNMKRWFRFAGVEKGDVVELQAINVDQGNGYARSFYAHATESANVFGLLAEAEQWEPPALYQILNKLDPRVAARSDEATWHLAGKGGTSDRDILARRVLPIDIDVVRPANISATDAEVGLAVDVAEEVVGRLVEFVPEDAIAYGDSGNGRWIALALDALPINPETDDLIKVVLESLSALHSTDLVKIDVSLKDAKRLGPAWGTMKRKGVERDGRRHRRTGIVVPKRVHRLSLEELRELATTLQSLLPAKTSAKGHPASGGRRCGVTAAGGAPRRRGGSGDASTKQGGIFARANSVSIVEVATELGLDPDDRDPPVVACPRGCSGGTSVVLLLERNLHKCSHNTCSDVGANGGGCRSPVDLWAEVRGVAPAEAAQQICAWAGLGTSVGPLPPPMGRASTPSSVAVTVGSSPSASNPLAWMNRLLVKAGRKDEDDIVLPTLANLLLILQHHSEWDGVLGYDERSEEPVFLKAPPFRDCPDGLRKPRPLIDADDAWTVQWFQETWDLVVSTSDVHTAINTVARRNPFDRVRDYLDGLEWDRAPRLETWLVDYLGADDDEYTRAVGMSWLISAVARTYEPGCKADHLLVFEGPQGLGKSSALRVIAGAEHFGDDIPAIGTKDAQQYLGGLWVVELAEMDAATKSESATLKRFLTTSEDRYRPPYGRRTIVHRRRCVFAGSVNLEEYLKDPTGGRRFWPVRCTRVDLDGLRRVRDQLWAEAVEMYAEGLPWHLDGNHEALATEQQAQRLESDPWREVIEPWLGRQLEAARSGGVTIREILKGPLKMDPANWSVGHERRVGAVLRGLGWTKHQKWDPSTGTKPKRWFPPAGAVAESAAPVVSCGV